MDTRKLDGISIVGQKLGSKLRVISLLLFVFPCSVVIYILHQGGLLARLDSHDLLIFLLILVLACAGIIVLRQAFEKFVMVSVFLKRAGNGEPVQMDLHHDPAELGEISASFNRIVARMDEMTGQMETLHADLEEANAGRRRAEDSLIALKKAVDIMQLGVTITDETGRIIYSNAADARMHGYEMEEMLGREAMVLFSPPECWGSGGDELAAMMSWKRETVNMRKDGSLFPVQLTSDLVTDGSGRSMGIVTTCEDITDKKRAEEELRESRQYLENIIQFFPDATMVIDNAGRVVAWNRAMELLSGIAAADMLGRGHYEYAIPFYNERRPMLIDLVTQSAAEIEAYYVSTERRGETFFGETPLLHVGGEEKYLEGTASALWSTRGEMIGAIESIRDVTRRKLMEEALQNANEFSRVVMDSINDDVAIVDVDDYRIKGCNRVFLKNFNLTSDEVIGKKCYEITHHRSAPCSPPFDTCPMTAAVATGKPSTAEHVHFLPDGEKFHAEVTVSPVRDGNNRVTRVVHVSRNITDRKRLEEERERLIGELREALNRVKTLSGMLPICARCKKIRDDKGYWNQLEAYITEHSDVLFSHGYCPDCLRSTYTEFEEYKKENSHFPEAGNSGAAVEGGEGVDPAGRIK